MKAICLLYHDVIEGVDWDSSGFPGPEAAKYKLTRKDFEAHVSAVAATNAALPVAAHKAITANEGKIPLLITFDDGGASAGSPVADFLETLGWRAHFFVTVGRIGSPGFLDAGQIRDLRKRGHLIGSHSVSHPTRMSLCDDETLAREWTQSIEALSDLLGEPVDTASVPGGYYSKRVAEAAAAAKIRFLFNSEPTIKVRQIEGCFVFGRFTIVRGMPVNTSERLASIRWGDRSRQWILWNVKKIAKRCAGRQYLRARRYLLSR